jgi:sugar diacid utilization regulator
MERVRDRTGAAGLRQLVDAVDEELIERIAEGMLAAMSAAVREVGSDPDIRADARAAAHETTRGFLLGIADDPWIVEGTPPALADLARTLARRGLDITFLMKLTRYGQAVFWPAIMETAERAIDDPSARMRALTTAFERLGKYVEGVLGGAVEIFQQERDLRMRGAHARRHEMIESLISGEEVAVDSVSRALGYELRRLHTALALWDSGPVHDALDRLESLARELAGALGAQRVLSTPSGSRGLWAWLVTDVAPGLEQRVAISRLEIAPGLGAAVGQPGRGLAGFRRSHEEALAAQRIALARDDQRAVTWYADVEIASLLARDARGARALVARELDGLSAVDPNSEKLRRTALAYLRCGGSATAAGRELGVHTNTVRYRIEQAEEALGRSLQGQQLPLQLALMLVETVGAAFLPDSGD